MLLNFTKIFSIIYLSIGIANAQQFKTTKLQELTWGTDLSIESYPDGRYSYLKVLAMPNGYAYLSIVDNSIHEFDDAGQKINTIPLTFKPINFSYHSGSYYVQDFHSIYIVNTLGETIDIISYPTTVKSTKQLCIKNGSLTIELPNNTTLEYNRAEQTWVKKNGYVIKSNESVSVIRKNDNQFELLYTIDTNTQCLSFNHDVKIGAVIFHGVINDKWIIELEEIDQEIPLIVTRKLLLIDPIDGKIKSSLIIPHQRFTFTPEDIVVENERIIISLSTATHSLVYEVELSQDLKPFPGYLFENPVHFNTSK